MTPAPWQRQPAAVTQLPSSPAERDALRILLAHHHQPSRVIRVNPDSILFLNQDGRPRTAWLLRYGPQNNLKLRVVDGFPPFPPDDFHAPPPPSQPTDDQLEAA